ncbi:DNA methylase [Acidovorax temperans]|uniref:DNA methylase n=1 Tax=Acidovorax temperans TaxID=80878 RepID=A0A0D7KBG1_9BURK|nr:site-specific DNA-methyltransferase [Acidovorax temperans]KJA11701.1 DNA methylase [Acidovorax temperans]
MPTLDWLHRAAAFSVADQVPYRLLETVSHHGSGDEKSTDNLLIHGDNLEALKALLPFYRGRIKCIFIDPPYNTQSAFEHYDDKLEHSQWLSMMLPRLELLRDLLSEDGSIWVTIDDNEAHYLKVLMDEVFGRGNFVANNVWQKRYSRENRESIGDVHDHLLVYAVNPVKFKQIRNRIPLDELQAKIYKNPENPGETDPAKRWRGLPMTAQGYRPNQMYVIVAPNGKEHVPPPGRCWSTVESEYLKLRESGRIYWGKDGNAQPSVIRFLSEVEGLVPWTWWPHEEVGHTDEAKKEANELFGGDVSFGTPKPERLIQRILHIATNPGDLVLDSFLGSGTTAAVAHKMGRRWIGIEMGEHALTHCLPRLQKVVAGEQGGISAAVGWGQSKDGQPFDGGGFRLARLGAPVFGPDGSIDPGVRFATLAAYIWQQETATAWDAGQGTPGTPYLGTHSVFDSYSRLMDGRQGPISLETSGGDGEAGTAPTTEPPAPTLRSRTAYYLLFNGILGDKRPAGGNVLTHAVLQSLLQLHAATPHPDAPLVVYGEACRLGAARLAQAHVVFKHIPYDVKAR